MKNLSLITFNTTAYFFILLFFYASISKILDFENFQVQIGQSPLLSAYAGIISYSVIIIELLIVVCLCFPSSRLLGLYASTALMSAFTVYIYLILNYSDFVPCSCGGILEKLGWKEHLIFNAVCVVAGIIAVLWSQSEKRLRIRSAAILTGSCITAVGAVILLFISSEYIIKKENNFTRRFLQHPIVEQQRLDLHYNSYYFAGSSTDSIYLGNYTTPFILTAADLNLRILKENDQNSIFALYMERGRMEIDHKKDPQKALEYYNKGLVIAKQLNRPRFYLPIYEFMADYYQKTKNPDMELYYVKKNKRLNDSLVIINQSALLSQNRISKKEALEEYKEIHTNTKKILLIGVMVIIIFTGFLMYYVKKRKKTPPVLFREKSENGSANKNMDETLQKHLPDQSQISTLFESAKTNDKNFLITFQQTFPELYQKLLKLNTELTPNDIELCAFLKLNIQTKEIALYKKSSIGSVDNRKYRLRKKLNLTSETNLYIWINEL